jgi:hypothetical protein
MKQFTNDHAWIHFGSGDEPRQTIKTIVLFDPTRYKHATSYKVLVNGVWRRVWQNDGLHVRTKGKRLASVDLRIIPEWVRYPAPSETSDAQEWIAKNEHWCMVFASKSAIEVTQ